MPLCITHAVCAVRHRVCWLSLVSGALSVDDLAQESLTWVDGKLQLRQAGYDDLSDTVTRSPFKADKPQPADAVTAAFRRAFEFSEPGDLKATGTGSGRGEIEDVSESHRGRDFDKSRDRRSREHESGSDSSSDGSESDGGGEAIRRDKRTEVALRRSLLLNEVRQAYDKKMPGAGEWSRIVL